MEINAHTHRRVRSRKKFVAIASFDRKAVSPSHWLVLLTARPASASRRRSGNPEVTSIAATEERIRQDRDSLEHFHEKRG